MPIEGWSENTALGKRPCDNERDSWQCPNMKKREGDADMNGEHYDCKICGRHVRLDYDEMR